MSPLTQNETRLVALDGLRGWAVLLVFCVHFFGTLGGVAYGVDFDKVMDVFELSGLVSVCFWLFYSHYGVYLFFCISGFVIARVLSRVSTASQWRIFLARRLVRIYPAFTISLALAVGLAVWLNGLTVFSWRTLGANFLFLNGWFSLNVHAYNHVSWSLLFEFVFYFLFSVLCLMTRRDEGGNGWAIILWFAFVVLLSFIGFREWFLFIPFGVGALAGSINELRMKRWVVKNTSDFMTMFLYFAATSTATVYVALPSWGVDGLQWPPSTALWLVASSAVFGLVILRVAYGESLLARIFAWRPITYFGRISFSFFLLHSLVITCLFNVYRIVFGVISPQVGIVLGVVMFVVSTLLAAFVYRFVELPAMELLEPRRTAQMTAL